MKLLLFIVVVSAEFSNNLKNGKTCFFFSMFVFQKTDKNEVQKSSHLSEKFWISVNLANEEKQGESSALCFDRLCRIR